MKTKTIFEPVFHTETHLLSGDWKACNKFIKKKLSCEEDILYGDYACSTSIRTGKTNRLVFVTWLSDEARKSKENKINTIAHEALHVTVMNMYECDIKIDIDNHETYCYLHGWITSKYFDFYIK